MIEIKPGPELDRVIATACGLIAVNCSHDGTQFFSDPRDSLPNVRTLHASTDLDDAFRAAEMISGQWELSTNVGFTASVWTCQIGESSERAFAKTPELAICAAILKVTGEVTGD